MINLSYNLYWRRIWYCCRQSTTRLDKIGTSPEKKKNTVNGCQANCQYFTVILQWKVLQHMSTECVPRTQHGVKYELICLHQFKAVAIMGTGAASAKENIF